LGIIIVFFNFFFAKIKLQLIMAIFSTKLSFLGVSFVQFLQFV